LSVFTKPLYDLGFFYFFLTKAKTPLPAGKNGLHNMKNKQTWQVQTLISLSVVAVVVAVCFPMTEAIGYRSVALILLMTVSFLAIRMHLVAVVTAALVSSLAWDYLFIPPRFTLTVGSGEDTLLLAMYFIIALLSGVIHYRLKQLDRANNLKNEREQAISLYNVLFNSLSHELRTPLAAIMGAADTLQDAAVKLRPEQTNELLGSITENTLRLQDQVDNLLNVSRIEAGILKPQKQWCEVGELMRGVVNRLQVHLAEHRVRVDVPEGFPLVQLDFGMTEQILQNLLTNAARYTPAGTQITLKTYLQHARSGHFETPDDSSDGLRPVTGRQQQTLVIEVLDGGAGFPATELDRVFEKFYRLKNTRPSGSGLGLYVVRGFVEAQGGDVSLSNDVRSGGAKFTLEIPTEILSA
jgi:two-component system, OmpR family, sensor histidine kinase KdpD